MFWEAIHNSIHSVERVIPARLFSRLHDYSAQLAYGRIAVCVVVTKGVFVLGVARRGTDSRWGLPGGWAAGGNLQKAAARNLREETGIRVDFHKLREIYRGFDDKVEVVTFCVDAPSIGNPQQCGAGRVSWLDWDQLLDGPFGTYNAEVKQAMDREASS